ncbi:hypothetical protein BDK51DRAFT_32514 [Blyttiomyces helicus]|uniref:Uncharacterized protein n=1 Tax=Blyttiomyces helicus TaxID=388810 RepID=A0A4P9VUB6_9FUNG|nr:hypothetical protein BDK51DRAFT_32514 [Blyttiomyces helicus]|eukprot:RKO83179.1 hypothetical protein BDK51DRAFT_32514 [Blyttiomyces helicus]
MSKFYPKKSIQVSQPYEKASKGVDLPHLRARHSCGETLDPSANFKELNALTYKGAYAKQLDSCDVRLRHTRFGIGKYYRDMDVQKPAPRQPHPVEAIPAGAENTPPLVAISPKPTPARLALTLSANVKMREGRSSSSQISHPKLQDTYYLSESCSYAPAVWVSTICIHNPARRVREAREHFTGSG